MAIDSVVDPANSPKLKDWIAAAEAAMRRWHSADGRIAPMCQLNAAKIWTSLLALSAERSIDEMAPKIPMRLLSERAGRDVDHRAWGTFESWYQRTMAAELAAIATAARMPALRPYRQSSKTGGQGEQNQAKYFLTLADAPASTPLRSESKVSSETSPNKKVVNALVAPFIESPNGIRLHLSTDCDPRWLNKVLLG